MALVSDVFTHPWSGGIAVLEIRMIIGPTVSRHQFAELRSMHGIATTNLAMVLKHAARWCRWREVTAIWSPLPLRREMIAPASQGAMPSDGQLKDGTKG